MSAITTYIKQFRRLAALFDKSAWMLIAPTIGAIFYLDQPLAKTLLVWCLFGVAIAGFAIIISRLIFQKINLNEFVDEAKKGNIAAAIVASAIIFFVGIVIIALVIWAKT